MMFVNNADFRKENIESSDLFIGSLGYEDRSFRLFYENKTSIQKSNVLLFVFDDYENNEYTKKRVEALLKEGFSIKVINYRDMDSIKTSISLFISKRTYIEGIRIHVDYSSMPRGWYCRLPFLLKNLLRDIDKAFFWYVGGEYPEEYDTAGVNTIGYFDGIPSSLNMERDPIHIIGLGYDIVRTKATITIIEPLNIVSCYAFSTSDDDVRNKLVSVNESIIQRSISCLPLNIEDFEFMLAKLCELTNDLLINNDVILLPDGPKPLVMAMSLVPGVLGRKIGLTCQHIVRNEGKIKPINVKPINKKFGFYVTGTKKDITES